MNSKHDIFPSLTCAKCGQTFTAVQYDDPLWFGACFDGNGRVLSTSEECANDDYPDFEFEAVVEFYCDSCLGKAIGGHFITESDDVKQARDKIVAERRQNQPRLFTE